MSEKVVENNLELKVSRMAENLIGSEILKLSADINAKIKSGEKIYNMTVGDFNPKIFPIPDALKSLIIEAYHQDETNYPPSSGVSELVDSVSYFLSKRLGLSYSKDEIVIAGGARPLIYAIYQTLLDREDTVLYPVPSWNNNHYRHLTNCKEIFLETRPDNNFMPTAKEIEPYIQQIQLLALCSPLNPTGTVFTKEGLMAICELVIRENKRRKKGEKPLYILFDQIYWVLTMGKIEHFNPVSLFPELKDYTIFVDGLSKAFAATGVRVGWGFGPVKVIDKMKAILGHVGAWAPKAEQVAVSKFLTMDEQIDHYLFDFKAEIWERLDTLYKGFIYLKDKGFAVDAIVPQAAIYLTVKLDLKGKYTPDGKLINNTAAITKFILDEAKLGIVPFSAFGSHQENFWYRISIGTTQKNEIPMLLENLEQALNKLSN